MSLSGRTGAHAQFATQLITREGTAHGRRCRAGTARTFAHRRAPRHPLTIRALAPLHLRANGREEYHGDKMKQARLNDRGEGTDAVSSRVELRTPSVLTSTYKFVCFGDGGGAGLHATVLP